MDIEHWRSEIDEIDKELLRLLNMRARLCRQGRRLEEGRPFALLRSGT